MFEFASSLQKYLDDMSSLTRVLLIIVCVLLFVFLYNLVVRRVNTYENFGNPKTCTYYYMNNCGYCEKFTPEWDTFVNNYNGSVILNKKERTETDEGELEKYNIQGFPTVIMCDENGEYKEFNGERTSNGLIEFIGN